MFGSGESDADGAHGPADGDGRCEPARDAAHTSGNALSTADLSGWVRALRGLAGDVDDAERIDQLRLLEELKSAAAAAQAVATAAFARSQRAVNGVPAGGDPDEPADAENLGGEGGDGDARDRGSDSRVGGVVAGARSAAEREQRRRRAAQATRSIRAQVALARKEAPHCGGRHVGLAEVLTYEMPRTLDALADGSISEWRATLICRETAGLSREHRAMVDAELAGQLTGAGDRRVAQLARTAAYRLDPQAVTDRSAKAASDRRVTIRPAPDTMTYVSALLPVESGVAVYAALRQAADSSAATGDGDSRGRGQLMADTLVNRILHPNAAGAEDRAEDTEDADDAADAANTVAADTVDDPDEDIPFDGDPEGDDPEGVDREDHDHEDHDPEGDAVVAGGAANGWPTTDGASGNGGADGDGGPGSDGTGAPVVDDPVAAVRAAYAAATAHDGAAPDASQTDAHPSPASKPDAPPGSDGAPPDSGGRAGPPPATGIPPGVHLEIGLIVTDQALFGRGEEPALLDGEVIPAGLARALVADLPASSKAWIRRLYTRPDTGQLAAMDSRSRRFDGNLRRFVLLRDQRCRTPWCDAPIRHADHARPAARGGPTVASNGDGLSQDCNYVREAPGWHANTDPTDKSDTLTITTPTGHTYTSTPPALHRPRSDPDLPATGS